MPKIVILGSCRFEPYKVLAVPDRVKGGTNDDVGYQKASKIFHPAIQDADLVIVYAPDNRIGEHTQRDIDYAFAFGKKVFVLVPMKRKHDPIDDESQQIPLEGTEKR